MRWDYGYVLYKQASSFSVQDPCQGLHRNAIGLKTELRELKEFA